MEAKKIEKSINDCCKSAKIPVKLKKNIFFGFILFSSNWGEILEVEKKVEKKILRKNIF